MLIVCVMAVMGFYYHVPPYAFLLQAHLAVLIRIVVVQTLGTTNTDPTIGVVDNVVLWVTLLLLFSAVRRNDAQLRSTFYQLWRTRREKEQSNERLSGEKERLNWELAMRDSATASTVTTVTAPSLPLSLEPDGDFGDGTVHEQCTCPVLDAQDPYVTVDGDMPWMCSCCRHGPVLHGPGRGPVPCSQPPKSLACSTASDSTADERCESIELTMLSPPLASFASRERCERRKIASLEIASLEIASLEIASLGRELTVLGGGAPRAVVPGLAPAAACAAQRGRHGRSTSTYAYSTASDSTTDCHELVMLDAAAREQSHELCMHARVGHKGVVWRHPEAM